MASILDFNATVASDPNFSSAWNDIQAQLQAEGGDVSKINSAKIAFTESFQQLSSQGFGISGTDAIASAKSYVMIGQTAVGAIGTVGGLLSSVQSGNPAQITQAFTGTMIGIAVAAGAVSAGVGAAIVGGVSTVLSMLGSAGLFGSSPPPAPEYLICQQYPDFKLPTQPAFVVNCMACYTSTLFADKHYYPNPNAVKQISPGAVNWRKFPLSSDSSSWAKHFYENVPKVGAHNTGSYNNLNPADPLYLGMYAPDGVSIIDAAFPQYKQLLKDTKFSQGPINDFHNTFFSAWKANAEYAFNGLKPQDDEVVLIHTIRLWNHSHSGPATSLSNSGGTYAASLISKALSQIKPEDTMLSNGQIMINVGPRSQSLQTVSNAIQTSKLTHVTFAKPNVVVQTLAKQGASASDIAKLAASLVPKQPITIHALYQSTAKKSPNSLMYAGLGAGYGFWAGGPIGSLVGAGAGYTLSKLLA